MSKFPVTRGAGAYSRSAMKMTEPKWVKQSQQTFRKDLRAYNKQDGVSLRGTDILDRVEANSRNASGMTVSSLPGGPGSFAGKVSKGNRPRHKAEG